MAKQAETAESLKRRIEALDAEGRYDEALTAFEELAALDPADDEVRKSIAEGACELAYELAATKRDRAASEAVYARLSALRERFPEDHELARQLAYAAGALSGLCDVQKDWSAAAEYAVTINRLNRAVPAELSEELELLYGRATANVVVALVEDGEWNMARPIVYSLRELLLSDALLSAIAKQHGATHAADLGGLFEAMVGAFRDAHPDEAAALDIQIAEKKGAPVEEPRREERGRVEERFDFETLKRVTIYDFVTLRVPARWPEAWTEEGRRGFWEEEVESGTLWIDWDLFALKGEAERPLVAEIVLLAEEGDETIRYERREVIEGGEPLVIHHWTAILVRGGGMLLLHFQLVQLADLAEREDFRPLPDLIAREVRAARVDFGCIPGGAD